jgi:hypothetical protein
LHGFTVGVLGGKTVSRDLKVYISKMIKSKNVNNILKNGI